MGPWFLIRDQFSLDWWDSGSGGIDAWGLAPASPHGTSWKLPELSIYKLCREGSQDIFPFKHRLAVFQQRDSAELWPPRIPVPACPGWWWDWSQLKRNSTLPNWGNLFLSEPDEMSPKIPDLQLWNLGLCPLEKGSFQAVHIGAQPCRKIYPFRTWRGWRCAAEPQEGNPFLMHAEGKGAKLAWSFQSGISMAQAYLILPDSAPPELRTRRLWRLTGWGESSQEAGNQSPIFLCRSVPPKVQSSSIDLCVSKPGIWPQPPPKMAEEWGQPWK